jgi:hypothetical protein
MSGDVNIRVTTSTVNSLLNIAQDSNGTGDPLTDANNDAQAAAAGASVVAGLQGGLVVRASCDRPHT